MSDSATASDRGQDKPGADDVPDRVPGTTAVETLPIDNPGIEEHVPRWTDVDKAAGDRAERTVVGLFALSALGAIAFVVIYFTVPNDFSLRLGERKQYLGQSLLLGLSLTVALLGIGFGAVQWARLLMGDHEEAQDRHAVNSSDSDREEFGKEFDKGVEQSAVPRRKMLIRSLGLALAAIGLPAIISLADLGPWPTKKIREKTIDTTIWAEGVRLVNDVTYAPLRPADIAIGQLVNAQPEVLKELKEDHGEYQIQKSKAAIIIVRMNPNDIKIPDTRKDWHVGGILCYSKICTHIGCPISLWEQQTHHLLCPCHQSTFDLGDSGIVVFGPAARALPQLPITVDGEGYLVARSGFVYEGTNIPLPVGPSYFERDSTRDRTREGGN